MKRLLGGKVAEPFSRGARGRLGEEIDVFHMGVM